MGKAAVTSSKLLLAPPVQPGRKLKSALNYAKLPLKERKRMAGKTCHPLPCAKALYN